VEEEEDHKHECCEKVGEFEELIAPVPEGREGGESQPELGDKSAD
jgi:hypothetical protein